MADPIVPYFDDGFQSFDFNGIPVRAKLDEQGNPMILADGVCKALGLANVTRALAGLPEHEKGLTNVKTVGGWQQANYITEPGLYRLIFRSNKPEAEAFRTKVFNEILPAVRKNNSYALKPQEPQAMSPLDQLKAIVSYMEQNNAIIAEIQEKQGELATTVEDIKDYLKDEEFFTVLQWCQRNRINVEPTVRNLWGKRAVEISKQRQIEIKEAIEGRFNVGRYHKSVLRDVCVARPRTNGQLPLTGSED